MLTYLWAVTLGLMTLGTGLAAYQFLYPRRPANEFGGIFYLGSAADLPPIGSEPQLNIEGRFWLANTEEGLRAFYNICTFPWPNNPIKYRWDAARSRFICPLCGSHFGPEGYYMLGPAPRNLDQFVIEVLEGDAVVGMTKDAGDEIAAPALPGQAAEISIDTGKLLRGKSA